MTRVRGAVPMAGALVVALLAIGLLGFSSTLNPVDALLLRGAIVEVPDVVGEPRPRAASGIEEVGLRVSEDEAFSLTAPRGTIIRQDPDGGERVREGSTVTIVVSRGANRVVMPDAVGQPFDVVAEPFEVADIPLQVERVPSERVPAGVVMEQSPGPGIAVTGLDRVSFVVSAGPADRPVPDVVGRSADGAAFELGQAGLTLGEVTMLDDPAVPVGAVVSADPPPGTEVPIETPVALVVSAGPAPVAVPDVIGDRESSARSTLEALGFVVSLASQLVADGEGGVGGVFGQFPEPGTQLRPGQSVTIVVGREPPAPAPPLTTTTTTTTVPGATTAPTTTQARR